MSISTNPFDEIERLFERMSRQFEDASRMWEPKEPFARWTTMFEPMAVDILENDEEFVATVDLPGFDREDIEIHVADQTLRIVAEHEERIEEEEERYLRRERRHETADRTIQLPEEIDTEEVTARMKHGVLTITLPKVEIEEARTIEIE